MHDGGALGDAGTSRHLPAIDGLRAIAVLAVVAFHFDLKLPGGFLGVDLFFAVSGFVIARGLLVIATSPVSTADALRSFYLRRFWRLWPAFVALLATTVIIAIAIRPQHWDPASVTVRNALAALLAGSNWFQAATPDSAPIRGGAPLFRPLLHLWSLSIEEQFYLVLPIAILVFRKRAVSVATGIGLLCLAVSAATSALSSDGRWSFVATPARVGAVGAGVLVAVSLRGKRVGDRGNYGWVAAALIAISVGVMSRVSWNSKVIWQGGYFVFALIFGAVVWLVAQAGDTTAGRFLSHPILQWFGTRSYSLYLVNYPIAGYIGADGVTTMPERIVGVLVSLVLAEACFRLIELPLRKRGKTRVPELVPAGP
jgi:peptidoglycan/LPS O-acetylase OafA/YrhL